MNASYDDIELVYRNWPQVREESERRWIAVWNIELAGHPEINKEIETELSALLTGIVRAVTQLPEEEFTVLLDWNAPHLQLQTTTTSHLIGSENMSAIIEMFQQVDQRWGPIKAIQSQPCELWPPWKGPKW